MGLDAECLHLPLVLIGISIHEARMGLDVLLEKKRVYGDISIHEARMGLDDKYHDKALELYKISIHEARMGLDLARTSTIAP